MWLASTCTLPVVAHMSGLGFLAFHHTRAHPDIVNSCRWSPASSQHAVRCADCAASLLSRHKLCPLNPLRTQQCADDVPDVADVHGSERIARARCTARILPLSTAMGAWQCMMPNAAWLFLQHHATSDVCHCTHASSCSQRSANAVVSNSCW